MNILIKLTCLVGLVIAPILGKVNGSHAKKEIKIEKTVVIDQNGETVTETVTETH